MELVIFLGTLFFFLFLNIPIALVMILSAICLMIYSGFWDFMIIPQAIVDGVNNYPLMAIPFFVFAGEIMAAGGLSKRVVQLAQLMVGRVKGGLGYAAIVASILFAGEAFGIEGAVEAVGHGHEKSRDPPLAEERKSRHLRGWRPFSWMVQALP